MKQRRPERRNWINKENPTWEKSENKRFENSNMNLRGKPHQQNIRDGRENSGIEGMIEEMDTLRK